MNRAILSTLSLLALASGTTPALAGRTDLPNQVELGRDSNGDPCSAVRYWTDSATADPFSESYSLTCRGATANRFLGVARRLKPSDVAALDRMLDCGAASSFTVPGIGQVSSRRCFDTHLAMRVVETRQVLKHGVLSVSMVPTAQGPAEEMLRLLARTATPSGDRSRTIAPVVQVASLEPGGDAAATATGGAADGQMALEQGLRYVRQGLHMEASRVLNDALSRLPANAPAQTRIELLLVAGLADSNLRFFDSAANYFQRADVLLAATADIPGAEVLARKRQTYAALDLLNRRDFGNAVGMLDKLASAEVDPSQPLLDPTTLRGLNQSPGQAGLKGNEVLSTPDIATLNQLVIDAQSAWARSVALLAQNKPTESAAALAQADYHFAVLRNEKISQLQVRWLEARIERQRARLLLRIGNRQGALEALDKAVAALKRTELAGSSGPTLAETQLERAGVLARGDGDPKVLLDRFDDAVETLISSDAAGIVMPPAIEQYLDLLVADARKDAAGNSPERFFRALQAVGNPAIARQFVQLQSVVTVDPKLAAKVQDEQDLEREITRIRFQIAGTPNTDADAATKLDAQRSQLETQLLQVRGELNANRAYGAVNDAPATIAEVRAALKPGEAYFKLTKVRSYVFGILIDAAGAQVYRVSRPAVELEPLAKLVRASIDGGDATKLPLFEVRGANALFRLIAGPAADRMLAAKSLIVDGSGPLETVPMSVLVPDRESVDSYAASRAKAPYDYSKINFMARLMPISTALSPRSLIVARNLAPSTAPLPFIGFAQHLPTPVSANLAGREISIGSGCEVEAAAIAKLTRALQPINARELDRAGAALGLGQVNEVTGADFTDTAVMARDDLDKFQVLHFATHGLTEGQWGCAKSPPALVTTLGEGTSDGILSFSEIAKLRLDANLVVLSACDTAAGVSATAARAAGQEEAGATLEGLVRAFLAANARAVLSTYWPISDAGESEQLIENFYGAARNGTIGEALRSAQAQLIGSPATSHPIYWGAFFVVGDAEKSLLSGEARSKIGAPTTVAAAPAAAPAAAH